MAHTISSTSSSSRGLLRGPPAPPSGLNTSASLARPCAVQALTRTLSKEQGRPLSLSHGDMQANHPPVGSDGTIIICLSETEVMLVALRYRLMSWELSSQQLEATVYCFRITSGLVTMSWNMARRSSRSGLLRGLPGPAGARPSCPVSSGCARPAWPCPTSGNVLWGPACASMYAETSETPLLETLQQAVLASPADTVRSHARP